MSNPLADPRRIRPLLTRKRTRIIGSSNQACMPLPLAADMTILEINNIKVNAGSTLIQVTDIGAGEFQFISHMNLPNKRHLWLDFKSRLPFFPLRLQGKIIWCAKIGEDCYKYGVQV